MSYNVLLSGVVHTRRQKSAELTWRYMDCLNSVLVDANLWNVLGFNLYATLFVCYMAVTSDKRMKSEIEVGAYWYVAVEHQGLSSIRVYFVNY